MVDSTTSTLSGVATFVVTVAGAFNAFCARYPGLAWRRVYDYGYGGAVYIVSGIKTQ